MSPGKVRRNGITAGGYYKGEHAYHVQDWIGAGDGLMVVVSLREEIPLPDGRSG